MSEENPEDEMRICGFTEAEGVGDDEASQEWLASIQEMTKDWEATRAIAPKSKVDLSYKEVEHAITAALRNAYHGGQPGWYMEPDDYDMPPFGDLDDLLSGKGRFYLEHAERMMKLGDVINEGIGKLIASNDPTASDKIRRMTQIAITAGYLFALIDDKAADKRKPKRANAGKTKKAKALAAKIQQYSIDHPDATQKQMAKVFGKDRKDYPQPSKQVVHLFG